MGGKHPKEAKSGRQGLFQISSIPLPSTAQSFSLPPPAGSRSPPERSGIGDPRKASPCLLLTTLPGRDAVGSRWKGRLTFRLLRRQASPSVRSPAETPISRRRRRRPPPRFPSPLPISSATFMPSSSATAPSVFPSPFRSLFLVFLPKGSSVLVCI